MKKLPMIGITIGFGLALLIVILLGLSDHLRALTFAIGAGLGSYAGMWLEKKKKT